VNNYNAHPIEYDHIIGAHNGTLDQASWDRLETAIGEKFPVDSQALIAAIAKLGVKDAIELCTEGRDTHTGAWSLTWFDKTDNSINFLRNKHRPLWIAHAKDFRRLLWASEWWMLEAAGRAENFEYLAEGKEGFRFFPTDENVHYKFDTGLFCNRRQQGQGQGQAGQGKGASAGSVHCWRRPFRTEGEFWGAWERMWGKRPSNPYAGIGGGRTRRRPPLA
jgi:hypothetical protein